MKSFVKHLPATSNLPLREVKFVKPSINSVSFHHHGKEVAITVTGENLWFCNRVKVGPIIEQFIDAKNISQKSMQFNCNEDKLSFLGSADHVSVKVWSHFSNPVPFHKVEVKKKVSGRCACMYIVS